MNEILDHNNKSSLSKIPLFFNGFIIACIPFFIEMLALVLFPFYFDKYLYPESSFIGRTSILFFQNFYWIFGITAIQFLVLKKEKLSKIFPLILIGAFVAGCTVTFLSYYRVIEAIFPIFYGNEIWNLKMIFWQGAFWGSKTITVISFLFILVIKITILRSRKINSQNH